jgi:predicted extracellular nuclease
MPSFLKLPFAAAFAGLAVGCVGFVADAHAVDLTSNVVISEVYGGGGNSGAQYSSDFIELYNNGSTAVNITGWSVQYASSAGTTWTNKTNLTGSIAPGAFFLIAEAGPGATGAALPTPDVVGTIAMSATAGKVALVNNSTALTCGGSCNAATGVVDFVGYGTATDSAGSPAGGLSNTTSAQRRLSPFSNVGNNSTDFTVAAPTPKAPPSGGVTPPPTCSTLPLPPECVPGTTTIQDVQGSGFISPLKGSTVSKVPGIVTGVRSVGSSRGFWFQQTNPDPARPAASAGLFVFTSSAAVVVGDSVLVSGTVSDFYPLSSGETVATTSNLSGTEISPTTVTLISHSNPMPAPVVLTSSSVPDTFAASDPSGNIEAINPVVPSRSAQEYFEAIEGMLAQVNDVRVVGPGNEFGEIYVTTKPTQQATPRGGTYIASYSAYPSGRLLVAPVSGSAPAANVGDVLQGATTGPVDWSIFGGYEIAATQVGARLNNGLTGNSAPAQAADQLSIATYNVENLEPGDTQTKFNRLAAGVVTNLASPDIITLEEVQDNNGATDDGTVAADLTLTKLTAAITAAGGPAYQWAEIDPVNDQDGGEPGGNIRVVLLYNPARVTFVSRPGGGSTTAVTVSAGADGTAELSVSPGRVEPTNAAWTTSRKPLAGEFVFGGKKVIVVANHFNSKGGDQNADGRFQPPTRSSEVQRLNQATVVNAFVKQILAVDPQANIVLSGDFNDYQFAPAMSTLTDNEVTLTDMINTLPVNERYTYNFNGVSQVLDHIFISKAIPDVAYDVIHLNSEFSDQVSDHDPQVIRIRPAAVTPPPVVPEAPVTVLLPLTAIGVFGIAWRTRRRRFASAP